MAREIGHTYSSSVYMCLISLLLEDPDIQAKIKDMMDDGVEIWACRACADNYGVSEELEAMGINVIFVGTPVTTMLKEGWKQLTF